jgi:hypothetical protein
MGGELAARGVRLAWARRGFHRRPPLTVEPLDCHSLCRQVDETGSARGRDLRFVSIDPAAVRENCLQAYNCATDKVVVALNDYAGDNDPFKDLGKGVVAN